MPPVFLTCHHLPLPLLPVPMTAGRGGKGERKDGMAFPQGPPAAAAGGRPIAPLWTSSLKWEDRAATYQGGRAISEPLERKPEGQAPVFLTL